MIEAMIFDLDGTLVQTEKLKALSYARAAVQLCPHDLDENDVIEAFKDVVGLSRREVAAALVDRFGLEDKARLEKVNFGVDTPWQAYVQIRLRLYDEILADPDVIRQNQWAHNVALLQAARHNCRRVGLATMSYCLQVGRVLQILQLTDAIDFVASRDDVERGKPNPEIYLLVAGELGVPPESCLVIEDSPAGVQAALSAGMHCIAVTTPFTRQRLFESGILDERWIVDDPATLLEVVQQKFDSLKD